MIPFCKTVYLKKKKKLEEIGVFFSIFYGRGNIVFESFLYFVVGSFPHIVEVYFGASPAEMI